MRRSQQRELRVLQADDLVSLMCELLDGPQSSYRLPYVSVVLCDPDHDIRHLMLARADVAMYRAKSAGRDQVAIGDAV